MRALLLISMLVVSLGLNAQPMRSSSPDEIVKFAYENLEKKDYINALDFLNQAYEQDNENLQVAYDIGKTYEKIRDYKKAQRWYRVLIRKDKENAFPIARVDYARMLKVANKYEEANDAFYAFLTTSENDSLKAIVRNEIQGIELAMSGDEPLDLLIDNSTVGVNTMFSEYSPTWDIEGSMYYSGYNRKEIIILHGSEDDYQAKIYNAAAPGEVKEKTEEDKSTRRKKTKKKKAASEALGSHINREGYHTSNVSISADGERMYFTRAILESNDVVESKIFVSYRRDGAWAPPDEVPRVNGDFIATMPAEGQLFGNRVLYFASNQDGGEGGFDLYYSTLKGDNDYALAVNLGTKINTAGDEYTPFYRTGILYFSSDHYPGLGGFDIFSSNWNGAEWSEPTNLGKGYNSSVDDLYFRIDESGYNGFVVSNRPGTKSTLSKTCCDDIFIISKKQLIIDLLAGVVDENNKALNGAVLKLVDVTNGDGETKTKAQDNNYLFKFPLEEEREYKVIVTRPGYVADSVFFDSKGISETYTIQKKISLKKIPVPKKDKDVTVITRNQSIRLGNIYYDFDDDKILQDAEKDLKVLLGLLEKYPTMVIELSSHTDAQGKKDYNTSLSQRRANSARSWLLQKGVNPERVLSKGYGEQFILNDCVDGVECDDDAHRYNRRTEFKIIAGPKTIEIKMGGSSGGGVPADREGTNLSFEKPIFNTGPVLSCAQKKVDLGTIKFGEKKTHIYVFANTGDEDLIIEHASACTCTEVEWPLDAIKPGQKARLKITFDSSLREEGERYGKQEIMVETITNTKERFVDFEFTIFIEE